VACLTTLPNIIHSDSPGETLASSEWQILRRTLGATEEDTIVLVWGSKQDVTTGASEIALRAKEATIGVPSETRQALADGTNGFERILPGPDRMYPDTDLPPIRITQERLERIRAHVPEPVWEREHWYRSLKIPADCIEPLSVSPFASLFARAVRDWGIDPTAAAVILIQLPKRVGKRAGRSFTFSKENMNEVLRAYRDGTLAREGVLPVLVAIIDGVMFSHDHVPAQCTQAELDAIIGVESTALTAVLRKPERRLDVLMGAVMHKVRGRVGGKIVAERIASLSKEVAS
jgi:glutamyl-tRNA(Gln) amidotransferase subunit E